MLYFLLHDAEQFHGRIAPALGASARSRSFAPVVRLRRGLGRIIGDFADRFRLLADEQPLLLKLSAKQPFDRRLWRHIAGELLLYGSADAPPFQTAEETLTALVEDGQCDLMRRAHNGSRDVDFDGALYRPGRAGINDLAEVARIADGLSVIDPANWGAVALPAELVDDPAEELAFAAECLARLRDVYEQARRTGQVVICEDF
jgi:hypothetical protein